MVVIKSNILIVFIILFVGILYFFTIREGHDWGDDFGLYIQHARNIVEGKRYDTGYIYNPLVPMYSPRTYPPVFPVLLSPVYKWFGLNLNAMKVEIIVFFLLFLLVFSLILKGELSQIYIVAVIGILGFNPYLWEFKENVLSEMPFLFFSYTTLLVIKRVHSLDRSKGVQYFYFLWISVLIFLCYGIRPVGLVLVPSFLLYNIICSKGMNKCIVPAGIVFLFLFFLERFFFHDSIGSLLSPFKKVTFEVVANNLLMYTKSLSVFWFSGYSIRTVILIRLGLFFFITGLAIFGYLASLKRKITILEIYALFYILCIVPFPANQGMRYLIPIIPLYVFYTFRGVEIMSSIGQKKLARYIFVVLMSSTMIFYVVQYTAMDYGPMHEGIAKNETTRLFEFIKSQTDEKDVFIFYKPRAFTLFTKRKASIYHQPKDDNSLWDYLWEINASYIIVGKIFHEDEVFLQPFVERNRDRLSEVYSNIDFKVYKIQKLSNQNI